MKLKAEKRELTGKKVKNLRAEGKVPATVYGPKRNPINVTVDEKEFLKVFKEASYNQFFDLELEGEGKLKVLVKDLQANPVTDKLFSISFYQVAEDRKITVEVPVKFLGEAPAVKQNLGFLIAQYDTILLHCFPKDLPQYVEVDLAKLETPADTILISSIALPDGVELDSSIDPESAIAYIGTAQKEEALEAAATAASEAAVAAAEAEKTEGAEGETKVEEGAKE